MTKYLIFFYVVTTFFLSGFAKAEQIGRNAHLQDVVFQKSTLDFLVSGTSSTACASQVMVADQIGKDGETIRFRVIETLSLTEMCIQKITYFTKRIPTKELIFISNLNINPDQVYTLSIDNSPISAQVLGSELLQ